MPTVVNKYTHQPTTDDVYIGRGSFWGNPFIMGKHGDRDQVVDAYKAYLLGSDEMLSRITELYGKNLVCFCAPKRCHGDVLKFVCEIATEETQRGNQNGGPSHN